MFANISSLKKQYIHICENTISKDLILSDFIVRGEIMQPTEN
jgi:hypothetical protein